MSFPSKSKQFRKIHSIKSSLLSLKLVAFLSVLFYSNLVSPAEVKLAWDANTEPDLAGYFIYYGFATGEYDYVVDVGDQTTFTLSGLEDGHTYYFAVTAYDTEDLESDISNEVAKYFPEDGIFEDLTPGHWAEEAIYKINNAGITTGCSTNPLKYCPEDTVTRAQMAVFLEKGIHGSGYTSPAASGIFEDVPVNYWAAAWIEQLYEEGITGGCGTNPLRYCPESPVTRAQMAVFLLKAEHGTNYNPPSASGIFADVPVTYWAAAWIEQLYNEGITGGCGTNPLRYCPESPVTRAQMAVFLVRTFDL